jgi:hypothetical protein
MRTISFGLAARLFLAILALFVVSVRAAPALATADEAKTHFERGVSLFEDRNFDGALAEFQKSFELKPTPAALQNIAVCQKSLHRYTDAIGTLEAMLRDFGQQLSFDDKKAAEDAIREMKNLLGSLVLVVKPPAARVTVDDRAVAAEQRSRGVLLPSGEHRVVAEAEGHKRFEQIVKIVSGESKTIAVDLEQQKGMLWIRAGDSQAAIVIDGKQVGYEEWQGPVEAKTHEVVVFTDKLRHRATVAVQEGQITELEVKLTATDVPPPYEPGLPEYVPPPSQRGLYGHLTVAGGRSDLPGGLLTDNTKIEKASAFGALGLSFGYRFTSTWAAEAVLSSGSTKVTTCDVECTPGATRHEYDVSSTHVGANGRITTTGRKFRIFGTLGLGLAAHSASSGDAKKNGNGAYGLMGGGVELNFGHFLTSAGLMLSTEGIGNVAPPSATAKSMGLGLLELRLGYGQW